MINRLLKLFTTHSDALLEHLDAYAQLAVAQGHDFSATLRQQVLGWLVVAAGGLLALVFAGVAALAAAVIPLAQMPAPWALVAIPAIPALVFLAGCGYLRSIKPTPPFALLRGQLALDWALLGQGDEK